MNHPSVSDKVKADAYRDLNAAKSRDKESKKAFSERMAGMNMIPAWEAMQAYGKTEPTPRALPMLWRYKDVRKALMDACDLITAKDAERRTLLLRNPGLPSEYVGATPFAIASFQCVVPGEPMSPHRHAQTALRLSIEGDRGYTSVEGEKIYVERGDVIIQPPHLWHRHGNDGDKPGIWFDGLDVGVVTLETAFFDGYEDDDLPQTTASGDARAIYGANYQPVNYKPKSHDFRIYHYPFDRTLEAIAALRRDQGVDPHHGVKIRLTNPLTGGSCMATLSAFMQSLPKGFQGQPYRSTESVIVCALQGSGETRIGDITHQWQQGDVFVIPSWQWHRHQVTAADAILFSYSEQEMQLKLGLWREQHGNSTVA